MKLSSKRRAQVACAVIVHVPLLAIGLFALMQGFWEYSGILAAGLVATVLATILVVIYVGHLFGKVRAASAREESPGPAST